LSQGDASQKHLTTALHNRAVMSLHPVIICINDRLIMARRIDEWMNGRLKSEIIATQGRGGVRLLLDDGDI
jgi:hypothetical protein